MSQDGYRRVGAITGLVVLLIVMRISGQSGIIAGALFGASGAVLGGIIGERIHANRHGR